MAAKGDLELVRSLGFDVRPVPLIEGVSSSTIRELVREGDVEGAAKLLGPARGGRGNGRRRGRARRDARLSDRKPRRAAELLVPGNGIYAGAAAGHRAAISIGTNPHYGGHERRVEAHLLDFSGDLYGQRLVVELWRRLRDEQAFETENDLIRQIAADVELARQAERPA